MNLVIFSSCAGRISPGYVPTAKSSPLYQKIDKIENLVYTAHKSSLKRPFLSFANKNRFYLYTINNQESKWIRIVFEYNGIDRKLFDKVSIKNGKSQKLEWNFSNNDLNTDNRHGGIVHEKKDLLITQEQFEKFLKKLDALGKTLGTVSTHYEDLSGIRRRAIEKPMEKINELQLGGGDNSKELSE